MSVLTIMRGLPGSGKTTFAKKWVAEDPKHRARVNRDDLRLTLHDGEWHGHDTESQVVAARDAMITSLLKRGVDVVSDDTNLRQHTVRELIRLARVTGSEYTVVDLTHVPVDECVVRDATREKPVGADVIRDMWRKYVKGQSYPLPVPAETEDDALIVPYVPPRDKPQAIIVDIDGTVALRGTRSPWDETRVHEDRSNHPVIEAVWAMWRAGHKVIFCTGRKELCRSATEKWLNEKVGIPYVALHMRAAKDTRKDWIVKLEMFNQRIRDHYRVTCVFDDRKQVVDMWRSLGLTVFQVDEGNF